MENQPKLGELLLDLGKTADEVAATLRAAGIKGVRNTVRYLNPVVRYVQRHLRVDDYSLDLIKGDSMPAYKLRLTLPGSPAEEIFLPSPVKEFLDAFNQGVHPDMELPP